ncbi:MAG TPA: YceI family protein [Asticcacaulis sp.]|nr:YceI family protein [Asticcacaulis sp.]
MRKAFAFLSVLALGAALGVPVFAAETYKFEPKHSSVTIYYPHFGLSRPSMKVVGATGTLVLDTDAPANSTVEVSLDMNALTSGLPDFDTDLKGSEYFDTAQFPTATFKSTKVETTGESTANVTGDLTVHGVTKSVTLSVTYNKKAFNPALFKTGYGFSATATLSRKDFGLSKLEPFVGDEINLDIEAEAYP